MTEVGLLYSHASRKIDREKLYTAGRYYVGVGGEFITYPITQQELSLPTFDSRTSDGLLIKLEVSINYKVDKDFEKILNIFDSFGYHYDGYLSRLAMNIIRDACANFTAFSYSQNRSQVSLEMERELTDDMGDLGFTLDAVQLLNVEFPKNFSDTLQETLIIQQQVTQAEMNKSAVEVRLQGELNNTNVTAEGILLDADTTADAIRRKALGDAQALLQSLQTEADSHTNMIYFFGNLSKASTEEEQRAEGREKFVDWYWMNQIASSPASKNFAIGIPSAFNP